MKLIRTLLLCAAAIILQNHVVVQGLTLPTSHWMKDLLTGYERRCAADPSFPIKSITKVVLAAGTQLTAEFERRGVDRISAEVDFVVAGVLTAMYGKYASMWKVAPTSIKEGTKANPDSSVPRIGKIEVPTNAFQKYLLDGVTEPSVKQRVGSLLVPMVPLFRSGVIASMVGYGATALLIQMRSILVPSYVATTQSVNIIYASLYTGAFMALVSNLRYQFLQGIIEPAISTTLHRLPYAQAALIFITRVANGILGSILAISGMRLLGLQKLR